MKRECPNCGADMEFILEEWICPECEYHEVESKKEFNGSFR